MSVTRKLIIPVSDCFSIIQDINASTLKTWLRLIRYAAEIKSQPCNGVSRVLVEASPEVNTYCGLNRWSPYTHVMGMFGHADIRSVSRGLPESDYVIHNIAAERTAEYYENNTIYAGIRDVRVRMHGTFMVWRQGSEVSHTIGMSVLRFLCELLQSLDDVENIGTLRVPQVRI